MLCLRSLALSLLLAAASTLPAAPAPGNQPVRVLVVASAATREYQFLRTLLLREQEKKRVELRTYFQPETQDAQPALGDVGGYQKFPTRLAPEGDKPEQRADALGSFDLVIAFDADWRKLTAEQRQLLNSWVKGGGGLIVVAGSMHTDNLDQPANRQELKPIIDLYPVVVADSRLEQRQTQTPWRLHLGKVRKNMSFLKLDPAAEIQAGWDEFFGTRKEENARPPLRGFYGVYPVRGVKPGAAVLATFADPAGRVGKEPPEQPYLATWAVGKGQAFWIGSGEMWRLRQYKESFHQRFWTELVRFVSQGAKALKE